MRSPHVKVSLSTQTKLRISHQILNIMLGQGWNGALGGRPRNDMDHRVAGQSEREPSGCRPCSGAQAVHASAVDPSG